MIDPVLEKAFVIVSGQKMIKLGDSEIEFSDQFSLALCTKLSNPNFLRTLENAVQARAGALPS